MKRDFTVISGAHTSPEMLYPNVEELRQNYIQVSESESFQKEFQSLLSDYVGRPTPLYFAARLSEKYNTRIYLKREDLCHTGAHKVNNTIGQILMAQRLGKNRIIAETGAGQARGGHSHRLRLDGHKMCIYMMGALDIQRQAPNVARMKMLGAEVRAAQSGSKTLKDATNEAIRDWINNPVDTHYIIGSTCGGAHPYPDMVARFQSVISAETQVQLLKKKTGTIQIMSLPVWGEAVMPPDLYYHFLGKPTGKHHRRSRRKRHRLRSKCRHFGTGQRRDHPAVKPC